MRTVDAIIVYSPVGERDTLILLREIEAIHRRVRAEEAEIERVKQLQLELHPEVNDEET